MISTNNQSFVISFLSGFSLLFAYSSILRVIDLSSIPFDFFVYGALLEEILKFLTILTLILLFKINPLSTLFFGLGFGLAEGLSHFSYPDGYAGLIVIWMHTIVGVVMSLLLKTAFELKSVLYFVLSIMVPIVLHGLYNSYIIYIIVDLFFI